MLFPSWIRRRRRAEAPAADIVMGAGLAWLLLKPHEWIERRIEVVRFIDARTLRRQMSVDFVIPDETAARDYFELSSYAPVAMLNKERLVNFSAWDESGNSLPTLTAEDNGRLAGHCLCAAAWAAARECAIEETVDDVLLQRIAAIAWSPTVRQDLPGARDYLGMLLTEQSSNGEVMRLLWDNRPFQALARELAEQFILFVPVDPTPNTRRVIKLSGDKLLYSHPDEDTTDESRWNVLARALSRFAENLSWKDRLITLDGLAVGQARSHHLEIEVPDDLDATSGYLAAADGDGLRLDRDVTHTRRVHLHLPGPTNPPLDRSALGTAWIRLRTAQSGLVAAAWFISGLIAATLWLAVGQVREIKMDTIGGEAVAILLAVPALFAAYLARPDEHDIVKRLLRLVRLLVALAGIAAFVAASALALGYEQDAVETVWRWCAVGASFAAVLLTISGVRQIIWTVQRSRRVPQPVDESPIVLESGL